MKKYIILLLLLFGFENIHTQIISNSEYWFDNAYSNKVTSATTNNINSDIDASSLNDGLHSINIRFKQSNELWSQTITHFFYKTSIQTTNQLSQFEYWLDDNYLQKVNSQVSGTTNTFNSEVDINTLTDGMHSFKYRYKDVHGLYSQTMTHFFLKTSIQTTNQLAEFEYWLDDIYANKISSQVTGMSNIFSADIDANALKDGMHSFRYRYKDAHGLYSQTITHYFFKTSIQTTNQLTEFEYWLDENYLNKVNSSITGMTNTFNAEVDVNSLKDGMHSFKYRYKDVHGLYSQTMTHYFFKTSIETTNQLSQFEYWLDDNFTNKVTTSVSGITNTFTSDIDVNSLTDGMHSFKYRYKDAHGLYSQTVTHYFYKTSITTTNALVKCEYWFDDDYSKKVAKPATGSAYNFTSDVDVNALSEGFHVFNIRFLDEHGNWSSINSTTFENLSPSYPTVTTTAVTNLKVNSVTTGGNITYDGHSGIIARGVCWNTTGNPITSDQLTIDGVGTGAYVSSISGLSPGTLYHIRAYATNSSGTSYGDDVTFTTLKAGGTIAFISDNKFNGVNGVYPQSGNYADYYEYRIIYTHPENKAPIAGFPKVGIDLNGDQIFTGLGEGLMYMIETDPIDQNYVDGKVYSLITQLPQNKILGYQFYVMDVDGVYATGEPTNYKAGPQVAGKSLDLSIYANDISFSNAQPSIGDKVVINTIIRNNSDFPCETFKVKFYDQGIPLTELTVPGISANSYATLSLDNIFIESGFHQIKVSIDENKTLNEVNVQNNSAIRPIIVGSPDFKGSMQMTAGLSSGTVYQNTGMALYGRGDYVDSYDPNTNVSGAEVRMFIKETMQEFVTYTNSVGNYSFGFNAPSGLGVYHITVRMTDFTLSDSKELSFNVIQFIEPIIPSCPPHCIPPPIYQKPEYIDLTIYGQNIWPSECNKVNDIIPVFISFGNTGYNITANDVKVDVYKDGAFLQTYNYTVMPSGTGQTVYFNVSFDTPGNHSIRAIIDPDYTVLERNESNNEMTFTKYIYQELQADLTPRGVFYSNNSPLETQPVNIRFRIDNILCIPSTATQVDIYDIYNLIPTKIARLDLGIIKPNELIELNINDYSFTGVGYHTVKVVVDPDNNCIESNEDNNTFSSVINIFQRWPELAPSLITLSNTDPSNAINTRLNSSVTNYGTLQSGMFNVQYYVDKVPFGTAIEIDNLLPGQSAVVTSAVLPNKACGHIVELRVDESNTVQEQNEYNNNSSRVIGIDIQPSVDNTHPISRDVWVAVGVSPDLWADIYNWGTFDAKNVGVTYELNGNIINFDRIDIPLGTSKRVNTTYMFNAPGDYDIYVFTDRNQLKQGEICELNENNNVAVIHVHVFYNDLEILSNYINPSNLNPNFDEPISISASFTNNGNANVGPFKVRFLVNSMPLGNDIIIPEAARNSTMTVQSTTPYSASSNFYGVHVIRVQLDPENEVVESNKDNNEASRAIIVGKAPDLLFDLSNGLALSNASPKIGETITIYANILNNGAASATADLNFYLVNGLEKTFLQKIPISVADHSSKKYEIQWTASISSGTIFAEITNSVPQEYNELNNTASVDFKYVGIGIIKLILPEDKSTITQASFDFKWEAYPNTKRYELWVDNNSDFSSPEVSPFNINFANITDNIYNLCANWLPENTYYWKVVALNDQRENIAKSVVFSFTYQPPKFGNPNWVPIYRAYNGEINDHFYCTSQTHIGEAKNKSYSFEKVDGYLSITPFNSPDMVPVYRFWLKNDKKHFYTTNAEKRDELISVNNIYEGISGYAYSGGCHEGLVKMYYLSKADVKDNFYTISEIERVNAKRRGYTENGILAYVSPNGALATLPWMDGQPSVGSGINPYNGNFALYQKSVFSIPGNQMSLDFSFFYNSYSVGLMSHSNPLGSGWNHNYNIYLHITDCAIYVVWPDGSNHIFGLPSIMGPAVACSTPGIYEQLTQINQKEYLIKQKNGTVFVFKILDNDVPSIAFLKTIHDRNFNSLDLTWSSELDTNQIVRLTSVKEGRQGDRELKFQYCEGFGKEQLIKSVTDPLGRIVKFEYDNVNLKSYTDAENKVTQFSYNSDLAELHQLTKIKLPKGNVIKNIYFGDYYLTQIIGDETKDEYYLNIGKKNDDQNSRFISHNGDPNNGITTLKYTDGIDGNIKGLLSKVTSPDNLTTTLLRNSAQNPTRTTSQIDWQGYETKYSWDLWGNVIQTELPDGSVHKFTYNQFGMLENYTDPLNHTYQNTYFPNGNLEKVQTPRGTTNLTYDIYGNVKQISDPMNRITQLNYNPYGRVADVTDNMNHTSHAEYDIVGRITKSVNAKSQQTTFEYNNNDWIKNITDPMLYKTSYSYDDNGNLIGVTNAKGKTTTIFFNSGDLIDSVKNPVNQRKKYEYDFAGRTKKIIKPDNKVISTEYDLVGNIKYLKSSNDTLTFDYDGNGNMVEAKNSKGTIKFTQYDKLNRLKSYTDCYNNTVKYNYDANGNIISIIYPGNKEVKYTYYSDNLLSTVTDWLGKVTSYYYYNDGSLNYIQLPNGITTRYEYDAAGRLIKLSNQKPNDKVINEYNYTLDELGNHISVSQNEPISDFDLSTGSFTYQYDDANRITNPGYTHDANGNMTQKPGTTTSNYTFDDFDMLVQASGASISSYTYDALGNRRSKTVNEVTTNYVLDINSGLSKILMETDGSGNVINYYVYGMGLLYRISAAGEIRYYHYDVRGSTVALTNNDRKITHSYLYDSYGKILAQTEENSNPYKFVGQWGVMDDANGLYFMRARYYDFDNGRFISEDPLWANNLYNYTCGNPIIGIDPKGLNIKYLIKAGLAVWDVVSLGIDTYEFEMKLLEQTKQMYNYLNLKEQFRADKDYLGNDPVRRKNNANYWLLDSKIWEAQSEASRLIKNYLLKRGVDFIKSIIGKLNPDDRALGYEILMFGIDAGVILNKQ